MSSFYSYLELVCLTGGTFQYAWIYLCLCLCTLCLVVTMHRLYVVLLYHGGVNLLELKFIP